MKKLEEVRLSPGWLAEDVRKAQSRLVEWHGKEGRAAASDPRASECFDKDAGAGRESRAAN